MIPARGPHALGPVAPFVVILFASIAYRWPALVGASTVNSDAAIVGLQAIHILRGEFAWLLFGSGYQTSVDSLVAAGFFAFLGATPLALMLSTLIDHVVATLLAYSTLARHLPRWTALVVTLPLVFTASPLHTYILGPPRQASLTLVFLAVWILDRAAKRPLLGFLGGAIASLACFADPYALLFLPPLLLFALLTTAVAPAERAPLPRLAARLAPTLAGAVVGIVPLLVLLSSPKSVHGEATFIASIWRHNAAWLLDPCLPWVMGTTAYVPSGDAGYLPWRAGAFRIVELLGPILVLGIVVFGVTRRSRPELRRLWPLGVLGAVVGVVSVAAFLVSPMVMDLFSARYLVAIVLMLPFALAPSARILGPAKLGALLAPFLASAAVSGWLGYGHPARGAEDEARLESLLRERGVSHAVADYWVSYRLTFLYRETIEVVPIHANEDRYAPYRRAFEEARKVAYIFDPHRSREALEPMLKDLATTEPYGVPMETLHVGDLTAVILERR